MDVNVRPHSGPLLTLQIRELYIDPLGRPVSPSMVSQYSPPSVNHYEPPRYPPAAMTIPPQMFQAPMGTGIQPQGPSPSGHPGAPMFYEMFPPIPPAPGYPQYQTVNPTQQIAPPMPYGLPLPVRQSVLRDQADLCSSYTLTALDSTHLLRVSMVHSCRRLPCRLRFLPSSPSNKCPSRAHLRLARELRWPHFRQCHRQPHRTPLERILPSLLRRSSKPNTRMGYSKSSTTLKSSNATGPPMA